jgi:hypothetical protein
MQFQVRVRVDLSRMAEFGQKLQKGELDRSLIRGETHCFKDDPAVGFSIWEAGSREEFNEKFEPWRKFYSEVTVNEVISPIQAMTVLVDQLKSRR